MGVFDRSRNEEAILKRQYVFRMCDPEFPDDRRKVIWTVRHMLRYINQGHSSNWLNYNFADWREGLREWTGWKVIKRVR